jgi:Tol biopolymer transport system component
MRRRAFLPFILSALAILLTGLCIAGPAAGSSLAQIATSPAVLTQTGVAAFNAAQTATAIPIPTLVADDLEVTQVVELPLLAAPGGTSAVLAPDGSRIAYSNSKTLCILDIGKLDAYVRSAVAAGTAFEDALQGLTDTPNQFPGVACTSIAMLGGRDAETIRWSPDGRYLVLTENFFKFFHDSDIWMLDTQGMALTDITDDGQTRFNLTAPARDAPPIDVVPRWTADGRLVFLRYTGQGTNYDPPYVFTIRPDGSDLQQVGHLETDQKISVSALAVSAEGQLAYNWRSSDNEALSGVWISDLDGGHARLAWHNADDPSQVPVAVDWSPDGQYVAVATPPNSGGSYDPEASFWRAVRVSDGQETLFSSDHFVWSVGWSPDGGAIVFTTGSVPDSASEGLYVAAGPGAPSRMLVPASSDPSQSSTALIATTPLQEQLIPWTANQTVMVGRGAKPGILIIRLAAP